LGWQTPSLKLKRAATKTQGFSMAKDHTFPEIKVNKNKCRTQPKRSTPPEVENTRFYQLSLDKPQEKPRPLNRHNKKNVDHQSSSPHSRGRNYPIGGHLYMGKKHHDEANMGRNQSIMIQNLFISFGQRPYKQ
jgi:hypothetical protein